MKAFIILAVCLVAVSAKVTIVRRTMPKSNISADQQEALKQCLKDYNIDPEILSESAKDKVSSLSETDLGCVDACAYKTYKYLKPDNTLDFDQLWEGIEKNPNYHWERRVIETVQEACRAGAGDNNCRFFQCMNKFDIDKVRVSPSETE